MKKILFLSIMLLVLVCALFLVIKDGNAVLYTINTDDGSVSDWTSQGIALFQTDAISDTAIADEDIWNTWVATTSDDKLAFLVQMAAGPALDGDQYRTIVASMDCDRDGIEFEEEDHIVYYFWESDLVAHATGNNSIGEVIDGSAPMGQRINDYLEWHITKNKIRSCWTPINIHFYSATSVDSILIGTLIDNSGELKGWDVPKMVELEKIQIKQDSTINIGIIILVIFILCIGILYFKRYRIIK